MAEQGVTITIPLTITISLGPPVLEPPGSGHVVSHLHHVGVNWDWGWYAYCSGCGCNRWLLLSVSGGPYNSHMAHCNVCGQTVNPPMEGGRNAPMQQMVRANLDHQQQHPDDTFPPPRAVRRSS